LVQLQHQRLVASVLHQHQPQACSERLRLPQVYLELPHQLPEVACLEVLQVRVFLSTCRFLPNICAYIFYFTILQPLQPLVPQHLPLEACLVLPRQHPEDSLVLQHQLPVGYLVRRLQPLQAEVYLVQHLQQVEGYLVHRLRHSEHPLPLVVVCLERLLQHLEACLEQNHLVVFSVRLLLLLVDFSALPPQLWDSTEARLLRHRLQPMLWLLPTLSLQLQTQHYSSNWLLLPIKGMISRSLKFGEGAHHQDPQSFRVLWLHQMS
jgi:hypothetical protein